MLLFLLYATFTVLQCRINNAASFISTSTIKNVKQHQQQQPFQQQPQQQRLLIPFSTIPSSNNNKRFKTSKQLDAGTTTTLSSSKTNIVVPTEWQGEVLSKLSQIIDPDLNRDIVTLGFIKKLLYSKENEEKGARVTFDCELTTPAGSVKDLFEDQCKAVLSTIPWIDEVDVTMTSRGDSMLNEESSISGLSQIKAIVAVSSCKGGVGKSTTAVNLAYALQSLGSRVGILDVDIYGPSLPTMITPDDENVRFVGRQIAPLQRNGVKLMSFGYINDDAAVMRGPMVNQLLDQLLTLTYWGPLDYLVLDMPPGTGDIQLTLSQRLNITAAVIVTTPQELSFVDVKRGIEMFDSVNVPSIAVVENMAYLDTSIDDGDDNDHNTWDDLQQSFVEKLQSNGNEDNDSNTKLAQELIQIVKAQNPKKIKLFGNGHKQKLSNQYGIKNIFDIPLLAKISKQGDSGTPFILQYPTSDQATVFRNLASSVVSEISKIQFNSLQEGGQMRFSFDRDTRTITTPYNKETNELISIKPMTLRQDCKCAACVEELTGKKLLRPDMIPETIVPVSMNPCGNYALSVDWSDGHQSLYPYKQILDLMKKDDSVLDDVVL